MSARSADRPADETPPAAARATGALLVDRELRGLLGTAVRAVPGASAPRADHVQPASVDLRLGPEAWRIRAGFLPGTVPVEERLAELSTARLSLEGDGAVLEKGLAYLVPLEEELALPPDLRARFNPRSSTGRCDVFTRVLAAGHPRFDEAPAGFSGRLWLEVAPLSFPIRLRRGDRLCQLRLARGVARLSSAELAAAWDARPLCFVRRDDGTERPLEREEIRFDEDGGLYLTVSLAGRDPVGWRAGEADEVVRFSEEDAHRATDFFEPVHAPDGRCILQPGRFYVFASRERLRIPPDLAAEMVPVDVGIGEFRNNYAGFFDNGFGWHEDADGRPEERGTPAVLEVRAHDVPHLVEDGQVFFRLSLFRTSARPDRVYGEGRARSYRDQDLTLARCFRSPGSGSSKK